MMITPSRHIPAHRLVRSMRLVYGSTIRARHVGKDVLAALKNLVGGEIQEYTKLMAESREQAIDRMIAEATRRGANAIVSVGFSTSHIMASTSASHDWRRSAAPAGRQDSQLLLPVGGVGGDGSQRETERGLRNGRRP